MSTGSLPEAPKGAITTTRIEESLVEPARRGLRRVGAGAGCAVGVIGLLIGTAFLAAGGLMAALGGSIVYNVGIVVMALGTLISVFGGGSFYLAGRAARQGDRAEIERRLVRMLGEQATVTDEAAAQRMRLDIRAVRRVADGLVRRGRLTVDVDLDTGAGVYALPDATPEPLSASAEERRALDDFDARVAEVPDHRRSVSRPGPSPGRTLSSSPQGSAELASSEVEVVEVEEKGSF